MLVRILGPLAIERSDGESVGPWAPKVSAVLGYLAYHNRTAIPSERLIGAIWSDTPPRSAPTALHVYICQLRSHFRALRLDPAVLTTRPTGYQLQLPASCLDLHHFEAYVATSRDLQRQGELDAASAALASAVGLWRGPALEGFRGLPAFDGIGRLLDEKRVYAQERRLQLELGLGRHHALISELYSLIEAHPTWESLYGYLMVSLYRSGRTVDALRAFDRIRTVLVDELGLEPGPQLQDIQRSILARDPSLECQVRSRVFYAL
ncbi:BTAD domain-containing putative transcriptional regulator [Streptomyces sp. NPDC057702]|uniref:AfsR/SARP family transcriptional regulator n=1 Tax=unclassified Streptomyces TaxID=2593676 RepID=UPI0036850ED6